MRTRTPLGAGLAATLCAALTLPGCSDSGDESTTAAVPAVPAGATQAPPPTAEPVAEPPAVHQVRERYEVGNNVYVRSLAVERENNLLWVGTSVGVHAVDLESRELRHTFTREHGLANEYVFAIGIDHRNNKWFGTNAGGVSRYRDGEWKTFFPMHGLADYWVYAFATQKDGTQWIGTWAGANSIAPDTGEMRTYVSELVNEWVYGIAVDGEDRVWFATEGGVSMFDGESWRAWTHADGLGAPNAGGLPPSANTGLGTRTRHDLGILRGGDATYNPSYVFAVISTPEGEVWAGTWGGGVSRFDGTNWTNFTVRDGLAGDIVYSITRDDEGVLWVGTNRGLSRYDGRTWRTFNRASGLLDNNVYAVAVAPNGDIWVGTRGGVARLAR